MITITYRGCLLYLSVSAVILVLVAVLLDFTFFDRKATVKRFKKTWVATGSMLGFFLLYFFTLLLTPHPLGGDGLLLLGTLCLVVGAGVNVAGRFSLKDLWANQIKIYDGHTLVDSGVFRWVRHPLYASIMLMLLGGSVMFQNLPSALLTGGVFIPFMYYRARQEERLLCAEVAGYTDYRSRTGMFLPHPHHILIEHEKASKKRAQKL